MISKFEREVSVTEQEPRIPSPNELSEIVFGSDLSSVINIPQMFEYAKDKRAQAEDRGNVDEMELWDQHLETIVQASPDLRSQDN